MLRRGAFLDHLAEKYACPDARDSVISVQSDIGFFSMRDTLGFGSWHNARQ
jgi:hypothetical protein